MSALLVKDTPEILHEWLKAEATYNRRSLNQQVLICLEWCMHTFGQAQFRNPFAVEVNAAKTDEKKFLIGKALAKRLAKISSLDDDAITAIEHSINENRASKDRKFDYVCFD